MNSDRILQMIVAESGPRESYYANEGYEWAKIVTDPVGAIEDLLREIEQYQLTSAKRPMSPIEYHFDGPYFMVSSPFGDELAAIALVDHAPEILAGIRLSECEYLMLLIDEFNKALCELLLVPCPANCDSYVEATDPTTPLGGTR